MSSPPSLRVIVSLTAIPSRMKRIQNTLNSLLNQSYTNLQVNLCLPEKCNKEAIPYVIPDEIRKNKRINIIRTHIDYGPVTKLFGTLQTIDRTDENTVIVIVDDDVIYGPNVIERLVQASLAYPECAIGFCGWNVQTMLEQGYYDLLYEEDRLLPTVTPANILEGYRCILLKPAFFDKKIFDYEGYVDCLKWVDDVWIGGYLATRKIPKIVIHYHPDRSLTRDETWERIWRNNYEGHKSTNNSLSMMPDFRQYNHRAVRDFEDKFPNIWADDLQNTINYLSHSADL